MAIAVGQDLGGAAGTIVQSLLGGGDVDDVLLNGILSFVPVAAFAPVLQLAGAVINKLTGRDEPNPPVLGFLLEPAATTPKAAIAAMIHLQDALVAEESERRLAPWRLKNPGKDPYVSPAKGTTPPATLLLFGVTFFGFGGNWPAAKRYRRIAQKLRDAYVDGGGVAGVAKALKLKAPGGSPWVMKDLIWARLKHDVWLGRGPGYVLDLLAQAETLAEASNILQGTGALEVLDEFFPGDEAFPGAEDQGVLPSFTLGAPLPTEPELSTMGLPFYNQGLITVGINQPPPPPDTGLISTLPFEDSGAQAPAGTSQSAGSATLLLVGVLAAVVILVLTLSKA